MRQCLSKNSSSHWAPDHSLSNKRMRNPTQDPVQILGYLKQPTLDCSACCWLLLLGAGSYLRPRWPSFNQLAPLNVTSSTTVRMMKAMQPIRQKDLLLSSNLMFKKLARLPILTQASSFRLLFDIQTALASSWQPASPVSRYKSKVKEYESLKPLFQDHQEGLLKQGLEMLV